MFVTSNYICPNNLPLWQFVTKRGSSFGYESSHTHRRKVSLGDSGSVFEGCSEDFMYFFSFLSILDTLFMYLGSCDHIVIANLVLVDRDIYIFEVVITVLSPISPCVVSFLFFIHMFLIDLCNLIFLFRTKMP